jgi:hypothetical protein
MVRPITTTSPRKIDCGTLRASRAELYPPMALATIASKQ